MITIPSNAIVTIVSTGIVTEKLCGLKQFCDTSTPILPRRSLRASFRGFSGFGAHENRLSLLYMS